MIDARLDLKRRERLGMVEAVWGEHKTAEQIITPPAPSMRHPPAPSRQYPPEGALQRAQRSQQNSWRVRGAVRVPEER